MQWRKPHPWDGGYAIPDYVMREPARFGTFTTKYRRRRSISPLSARPPGWQHGLSIPEHVQQEPVGQGVHFTKYTPRRTVGTLVPQYLSGLGDDAAPIIGGKKDAIAAFGKKVSTYVMREVMKLPAPMRKDALKSLFNELDPKLWDRVQRKAEKLARERDMGPMEALEKAIASSASLGLLEQIMDMGRRGAPAAKPKSLPGVATDTGRTLVLNGYMDQMTALGWCGPICLAKKAGSAIKTGATKVGSAVKTGVTTPVKYAWSGIKSGSSAVYNFGKKAIDKIGGAACTVLRSDAGALAAAAGGAAAGGPQGAQAGMVGAQVGKALCGGGQQVAPPPPPPKPFPTALVVGGAAAAIGVLILATRK